MFVLDKKNCKQIEHNYFKSAVFYCTSIQDMNEVSSFVQGSQKGCKENKLNYPPFTPGKFHLVIYLPLTADG